MFFSSGSFSLPPPLVVCAAGGGAILCGGVDEDVGVLGLCGGDGIGPGEGDENGSSVVCGLSGSGGVGNSNGACCVVDGGENDASNDLVSVVVLRCFRCLRT